MLENQPNPEIQEALPKAAEAVSDLYMGDQLGALLGTQGVEKRDHIWNETAQEYPAFSEKIKELRERLKVVTETKKAYPPLRVLDPRLALHLRYYDDIYSGQISYLFSVVLYQSKTIYDCLNIYKFFSRSSSVNCFEIST